jgi:riboflavin kinase / FMN adenylyltransferase
VRVARSAGELAGARRAVAIGTFDGVHLGHRRVLEAALAERAGGLVPTTVTFDPHPRTALGNRVELLATLERRLELIAEIGIEDTLVVEFDLALARLEPSQFVDSVLRRIGTEVVVAGDGFRFGRGRSGDLSTLRELGFDVRSVPLVESVSSTAVRGSLRAGELVRAAEMLGRAPEVEGVVVSGDSRGGTLGFPTANLRLAPDLLVPQSGIYAGWASGIGEAGQGRRAAVSIGVNPHYGGEELRVEAFLLDFAGDLYGRRLVVELWRRLRNERAFASEHDLVEQIARDVEETRAASRPV